MTNELFLSPVYLVGHLWEEGAAAEAFTDINAMTMLLKLINTLDAAKHGDLDVDII